MLFSSIDSGWWWPSVVPYLPPLAPRLAPGDLVILTNVRVIECSVEPACHGVAHPADQLSSQGVAGALSRFVTEIGWRGAPYPPPWAATASDGSRADHADLRAPEVACSPGIQLQTAGHAFRVTVECERSVEPSDQGGGLPSRQRAS